MGKHRQAYEEQPRLSHFLIAGLLCIAAIGGSIAVWQILSAIDAQVPHILFTPYPFGLAILWLALPIPLAMEYYRARTGRLLSSKGIYGLLGGTMVAIFLIYELAVPAFLQTRLHTHGYQHCVKEDSQTGGGQTGGRNAGQSRKTYQSWRLGDCPTRS